MRIVLLGLAAGLLAWCGGCVNVKAPDRIDIGGAPPERVDPARVPNTASHEEAREELRKAYRYVQYLEDEVAELKRDKDKCKRQRDEYKDERDALEKKVKKLEKSKGD